LAVWVFYGGNIALLAGRWFRRPAIQQPVDYIAISSGTFALGPRKWPLIEPGANDPRLFLDRNARVVLYADGRSFPFGPVQKRWDDALEFGPDTGDVVSFTRAIGQMSFPTPFFRFLNVLGGPKSRWSRYAYDELRWTKTSGAALAITWRDQQRLWPNGWADEYNNKLTLLKISLSPADQAATEYLSSKKKWDPHDYRLESRDSGTVAAIHLKDEAAQHPGSGASVLLKIGNGKVIGETAWQ
jgi:hypothetical protein